MAFPTQDNAPVYNSILVTDYLTKMSIKTVPHPPYSPDFSPCDFCLFPKLRGYRYETIEEMKEAVTKVIDTLTQEDFHWAFQKLLERCNKCIATARDYFESDYSFMCVLSIKVPIWKNLETYLMILAYSYVSWTVSVFSWIYSFFSRYFGIVSFWTLLSLLLSCTVRSFVCCCSCFVYWGGYSLFFVGFFFIYIFPLILLCLSVSPLTNSFVLGNYNKIWSSVQDWVICLFQSFSH